jgi:hypothetical protein
MDRHSEETRSWEGRRDDPERAVAELREGIQRAREQVRHLREALHQDQPTGA